MSNGTYSSNPNRRNRLAAQPSFGSVGAPSHSSSSDIASAGRRLDESIRRANSSAIRGIMEPDNFAYNLFGDHDQDSFTDLRRLSSTSSFSANGSHFPRRTSSVANDQDSSIDSRRLSSASSFSASDSHFPRRASSVANDQDSSIYSRRLSSTSSFSANDSRFQRRTSSVANVRRPLAREGSLASIASSNDSFYLREDAEVYPTPRQNWSKEYDDEVAEREEYQMALNAMSSGSFDHNAALSRDNASDYATTECASDDDTETPEPVDLVRRVRAPVYVAPATIPVIRRREPISQELPAKRISRPSLRKMEADAQANSKTAGKARRR